MPKQRLYGSHSLKAWGYRRYQNSKVIMMVIGQLGHKKWKILHSRCRSDTKIN